MSTTNRVLSAAILAVLCFGAQSAPLDPKNQTPDLTTYVSGASAVDNLLRDRLALYVPGGPLPAPPGICLSEVSYLLQTGSNPASVGNYWGVYCNTTYGKTLILKRSAGGSAFGVGPVNDSTPIAFIDRNSCALSGGDAGNTYDVYTCPALANAVPDGGISDCGPPIFVDPINGGNNIPFTNLEVNAAFTQVFGIVVNTKFRDALQAAQFGSAHHCVTNAQGMKEKEPCMPSLTSDQLHAIFSVDTSLQTWVGLRTNLNGVDTSLTSNAATAPYRPAPFDNKVHICRRVNTSGTQAAFNANILDNPSKAAVGGALTPYDQANTVFATGPIVWNGSGSSDVEKCLQAYDSNGPQTITAKNGSTQINPAPGESGGASRYAWAIGIMGTEKNDNLALPYRFIKIDNVAPTGENVWNGKYYHFCEATSQNRIESPTPDPVKLFQSIFSFGPELCLLNIGPDGVFDPNNPAIGGDGDAEHQWGLAGYLRPSTQPGAVPDSAVYNPLNCVTNYVRFGNPFKTKTINPAYKARIPFNSGDTSLDTNGALNAGGTAVVPNGYTSW